MFSVGLDQRLRCWKLEICPGGSLGLEGENKWAMEVDWIVVDVPEPVALAVEVFSG